MRRSQLVMRTLRGLRGHLSARWLPWSSLFTLINPQAARLPCCGICADSAQTRLGFNSCLSSLSFPLITCLVLAAVVLVSLHLTNHEPDACNVILCVTFCGVSCVCTLFWCSWHSEATWAFSREISLRVVWVINPPPSQTFHPSGSQSATCWTGIELHVFSRIKVKHSNFNIDWC